VRVSFVCHSRGPRTFIRLALLALGDDPGRFDQLAIIAGAPVGNGRFVGVQLDGGIVNFVARERGQDVLDSLDSALPLPRVVERLVCTTFSMRASISGLPSRSTRRNRRPRLGPAGENSCLPDCRCAIRPGVTHALLQSLLLCHNRIKQTDAGLGKRKRRQELRAVPNSL